ncbi:hypothetical protein [Terricaulis silvestris]|uniref:Uncharacterized protein n=1 Tax=Terricaulis silvestris TaxID=2686094 RepID=A0A6I6MGU0_9CAUL|nr:hypothetical protein [Terricaulis silvestris]QGZ93965.1 hypothetical protein DSM104635_00780 [Terricaulis silvestris]
MLRLLILSAAIILGGCQAEPEPPTAWTLEREYDTDCLGWLSNAFQYEGVAYTSRGWGNDNHFMALNLVTGECTRAGNLPVGVRFQPRAATQAYLLASDGHFINYSIYDRTTWRRLGSIGLNSALRDLILRDDRLYALQSSRDGQSISVFTVPDLEFVEERALALTGYGGSLPLQDGFLLASQRDERVHLTVIDLNGRAVREHSIRAVEPDPTRNCPPSLQPLGANAVLLQAACGSYAVVDVATFAVRYTVALDADASFAEAYLSDGILYLLAEHSDPHHGGLTRFEPVLFDFVTGERIGALPALTSNSGLHIQVGDRLIWATHVRTRAHVQVFDLRARPAR